MSNHPLREITDPQEMRALAHPIRMALIETLRIETPLTATEAGERIGESPTTCSFHLRQLARYGFVEEAGGGKGRSRPWRLVDGGSLRLRSDQQTPEAEIAATALESLFRDRQLQRLRTWRDTRRSYPARWRDAAVASSFHGWMTPDELRALSEELLEFIGERVPDRSGDPDQRPDGALPIELLLYSYPTTLPEGGLS